MNTCKGLLFPVCHIGASLLTMRLFWFAYWCVITLCAVVLLVGASSLTTCNCFAWWCVFAIRALALLIGACSLSMCGVFWCLRVFAY